MEFEKNSLIGRLFEAKKGQDEESSRIETIPGKNRVLIIAPHGFNGDESRNLKADDENTGFLARNLATKYGFFGVINETYRKPDSSNEVDPSRFIIDCNRIDQVETHLKKEYLDKILEYKDRIIREKYGTPLIIHLHGIGVANLQKYIIENTYAELSTAILVGYGQNIDEERLTADEALVDQLIEHLENNEPSIKAVKTNPGYSSYRGWHKDTLNQLFRHKCADSSWR